MQNNIAGKQSPSGWCTEWPWDLCCGGGGGGEGILILQLGFGFGFTAWISSDSTCFFAFLTPISVFLF